jgi:Mrp family chromosome partitioning ATPase
MLVDGHPSGGHGPSGVSESALTLSGPVEHRGSGVMFLAMTNGPGAGGASDALWYRELERIIENARHNYDVLILESAPALMRSDALVLGRFADMVVHVVRWGMTKKKVVTAALNRLQAAAIPVTGVVLTRVNVRKYARFNTFDECFYYRKNQAYYDSEAKRPAAMPTPMVERRAAE